MTDDLTWSEQLEKAQLERLSIETQLRDTTEMAQMQDDVIKKLRQRLAECERDKPQAVAMSCEDGYSGWLYSPYSDAESAWQCDRIERDGRGVLWLWAANSAFRLDAIATWYRARSLSGPWVPVLMESDAKGGA